MPNSVQSFQAPIPRYQNDNLALTSTIQDVLNCVPRPAWPLFKPALQEFFQLGVKISHATAAQETLRNYETSRTFPPSIMGALKIPALQVSKEFQGSSEFSQMNSELATGISKIRASALSSYLSTKSMEESFLLGLVDESAAKKRSLALTMQLRKAYSSAFPSESKPTVPSSKDSEFSIIREDLRTCEQLGHYWLRRATSLGIAKHQSELVQKMSKLQIKSNADTEMRDLSTNDIEKTIQQAIARELRKQRSSKPQKPQGERSFRVRKSRSNPDLLFSSSSEEGPEAGAQKGQPTSQEEARQTSSRKRKWEWEREVEEAVNALQQDRDGGFSISKLNSFPSKFWQSSVEAQSRFLLLNSSPTFVDSVTSYQGEVFKGPGVSLPKEIEQILVLNGKFVFHQKAKASLVEKAFSAFQRSVRTRYYFRDSPENRSFIPKFHIKKEHWDPPEASDKLETALREIRTYLAHQVESRPLSRPTPNPNFQVLFKYLTEKDFLVKITDKNLGLSVVSLSWYREQVHLHLSDKQAYDIVNTIPLEGLKWQLQQIFTSKYLLKTIRDYIESSTTTLPRFYIIPKVHKTPTSSRPIIPSHSWITSKVAEVVDWALQPLLSEFPSVLNSTSDLITKIRKEGDYSGCWLVTGDVTAMYTNIPPLEAIETIKSLLPKIQNRIRKSDLVRMVEFVLFNNYFQFEDQLYHQRSGLAMGVACAPVIANLFCGVYEKARFKYRDNRVRLFGRYIDDILLIFKGSEEDLNAYLKSWKYPNLTVTWEYSRTQASFLDVDLRIVDKTIRTSVFQKALNKHQYIPFSSAHPIAVKRAFVKAERMRYKNICSKQEDFLKVERLFFNNLLRRGYPVKILGKWFAEELVSSRNQEPQFILPSEYNPIWEYIRIGPIKEFLEDFSSELPGVHDLVLSLRRGKNLYDQYNLHNITILDSSLED